MKDKPKTPFHPEMQCYVESIGYDFAACRGEVYVGWNGCTDMGGCIAFFERIDTNVRLIDTWSFPAEDSITGSPDTIYFKNQSGHWEARSR